MRVTASAADFTSTARPRRIGNGPVVRTPDARLAARATVAEYTATRAIAERVFDRTPNTESAFQMANQLRMVFARLDCTPRWRERSPEHAIPTLVVHNRHDPVLPHQQQRNARTRDLPRGCARTVDLVDHAIDNKAARLTPTAA